MKTSYFKKNIELLKKRFPLLVESNSDIIKNFCDSDNVFTAITNSRDGAVTASTLIAGRPTPIHSKYNVGRETKSVLDGAVSRWKVFKSKSGAEEGDFSNIIFFSVGLGYGPIAAATEYKNKTLILVEPDIRYFLSALLLVDWSNVFLHSALVILLGASVEQCASVISHYGVSESVIVENQNCMAHDLRFFSTLKEEVSRHLLKERINRATLKRFGSLWERNCTFNALVVKDLPSGAIYKGLFGATPFLVLGAGPSLAIVLPILRALKERFIIVAVDSALGALMGEGVAPHFVIITDSQRAAYMHIARYRCPDSVLVAPIEVYPAVFRLNYKKIVICKSANPYGAALEDRDKKAADLDSGGSVLCSAVNFAAFCQSGEDSREIYLVGSDLAFPKAQTHIKGGENERAIFIKSNRLKTALTSNAATIYSSATHLKKSYTDGDVLTDDRMEMFAYYLEKRVKTFYKTRVYNLYGGAQEVKGIDFYENLGDLIKYPKVSQQLIDNISR